jgi:hypothetical protein
VAIDNVGRVGIMAYTMSPGGLISVVLMLAKSRSLRFGRPITVAGAPFNPYKGDWAPTGGSATTRRWPPAPVLFTRCGPKPALERWNCSPPQCRPRGLINYEGDVDRQGG